MPSRVLRVCACLTWGKRARRRVARAHFFLAAVALRLADTRMPAARHAFLAFSWAFLAFSSFFRVRFSALRDASSLLFLALRAALAAATAFFVAALRSRDCAALTCFSIFFLAFLALVSARLARLSDFLAAASLFRRFFFAAAISFLRAVYSRLAAEVS